MLLQLTVENFWSFRKPTTFSMLVPDESNPPSRNYVEAGGYRVLRAAALYGANASGKSNFHRVFDFCKVLLLQGSAIEASIDVWPFLLDPACANAPSQFEFELLIDDVRYSYGFRVDRERIHGEWLFQTKDPNGEEERIFERTGEDGPYEFGECLRDSLEHARLIEKTTRPNRLFLKQAAELNLKEILPAFLWFFRVLQPIGANSRYAGLVSMIRKDAGFRERLAGLLADVDTGIRGLDTRGLVLGNLTGQSTFVVDDPDAEGERELIPEGGQLISVVWQTSRFDTEKHEVRFNPKQESDGTKRFMHLAPALFHSSEDTVFVIDEVDRSLHTLLVRNFVERFLDDDSKPRRQLIFTTHDTNLLTTELLPPEAIWFAEKDQSGATDLYSLAEFNPEQLEKLGPSLEAGYLAGRFGAIPFIADRDRLGWLKKE